MRPARQRLAEPRRPGRRRLAFTNSVRVGRRRAGRPRGGGEASMWEVRQAGPRGRRRLYYGTPHRNTNDAEPGARLGRPTPRRAEQIWRDATPQSAAVPELARGAPLAYGKTGPRERAGRSGPGTPTRRVLERTAGLVRRRRVARAGPLPAALCGQSGPYAAVLRAPM